MTLSVNGQVISPEAIEYELGRLVRFYAEHMSEAQIRSQLPALQKKAREQAVGAKLLLDEAARLDIRVPDEDVAEKLAEVVASTGGPAEFQRVLKAQNMTEAMVRDGIAQGRKVDLLIERQAQGLSDPTEAEMQEHFASHTDEYSKPERAAASHILVAVEAGDEAKRKAAKAKIADLRQQIEKGGDFAALAAAHSDCPSGEKSGGSLGWFSRGMMVPEFDAAVFSMEVGALSEIIETSFGFHIIRKTGKEDGGPVEYDEVRDKVRDFLRHVARGQAVSAYVADLRAKAVIVDN